MYKLCKTEQSAKRQRELEQGLLAAMATQHYDKISVSDLCDQMNVPRKSFYRFFSSKDGALYALIDHTLLEFEGFTASDKPVSIRTYQSDLERFFCFWKARRDLLDALKRSNISGMLVLRCIDHAVSDVGIPTRFLPHKDKYMRQQAAMFGVCGLMSMVLNWHEKDFEPSESQMAEIATQLMTKPLFTQNQM